MTSITFWGLTASPYQLKMQSSADFAEVTWRRLPEQGSPLQALNVLRRLRRDKASHAVQRFPSYMQDMDEYPAVPFYTLDEEHFYYDSTGLALHLDSLGKCATPLLPDSDAEQFLCHLIDEAFDEFGLYMVHHNRWATSASTNIMGEMTAREMAPWLPAPLRWVIARRLARSQSRRCPYLLSVAPPDFDAGVASDITPPMRPGFPPTHELLDTAWRRYLAAMEHCLAEQPFLLGEQFTLADASAYGQLSMNLVDGRAAEILQELAPITYDWLCMIRDGGHRGATGELRASKRLLPLLECIADTFIPLMQQNEVAYRTARAQGQRQFNEQAFDTGQALYDGELMGYPFRSVAKSFQVVTWRELCVRWRALEPGTRQQLKALWPALDDDLFSNKNASPVTDAP